MKRILLIALMVLLTSVVTHAQTDSTWETWVLVEYTDTEGRLTGETSILADGKNAVPTFLGVETRFFAPVCPQAKALKI